jgi:hypothetical protein
MGMVTTMVFEMGYTQAYLASAILHFYLYTHMSISIVVGILCHSQSMNCTETVSGSGRCVLSGHLHDQASDLAILPRGTLQPWLLVCTRGTERGATAQRSGTGVMVNQDPTSRTCAVCNGRGD